MSEHALLTVTELTLRFGGVTALNAVSFDVKQGEFFAIIGPNGAGKTSLFNCLSGLGRPQGSALLDGKELIGRRADTIAGLGLGRTFQNLGLFSSMTVLENVLVGYAPRIHAGIPSGLIWWGRARKAERAARLHAYAVLDLVGLAHLANEPISSLPYGTRKRVELAKAVALNPRLLLLDEPVAGMNREETEEIVGYIYALQEQLDLTLIMIEHDIHLIMDLADRVLAIDFGQVIGLGTPDEIQENPRVLEAYFGVSGVSEEETSGRTGSRSGKQAK
jgi:branched-chain amino acid transport system ATP-binding protein